jgi:hypothetical protein
VQLLFYYSEAAGGIDVPTNLPAKEPTLDRARSSDEAKTDGKATRIEDNNPARARSVQKLAPEAKVDVARIVLAHAELFGDKFPHFLHRLTVWIEVA